MQETANVKGRQSTSDQISSSSPLWITSPPSKFLSPPPLKKLFTIPIPSRPPFWDMVKLRSSNTAITAVVGILGVLSFVLGVAAEFTKNKLGDVRLDAKFCSLPTSPAFGLGIAAAFCLLVAQAVGFTAMAARFLSTNKKFRFADEKKAVAAGLGVFSWACLALAILFLGVGSSMNQLQPYGQGWLDGECYVVRPGMYTGAALLAIATLVCTMAIHPCTITCVDERDSEKRPAAKESLEEGVLTNKKRIEATIN